MIWTHELDADLILRIGRGDTVLSIAACLNIVADEITDRLAELGEADKTPAVFREGEKFAGCLYIEGEDFLERMQQGEVITCGEPRVPESSYCITHKALCYDVIVRPHGFRP